MSRDSRSSKQTATPAIKSLLKEKRRVEMCIEKKSNTPKTARVMVNTKFNNKKGLIKALLVIYRSVFQAITRLFTPDYHSPSQKAQKHNSSTRKNDKD